jgi:hypothetical protein
MHTCAFTSVEICVGATELVSLHGRADGKAEEARAHRVVEGLESFCHVLRISYAYYPHVTDDGWRHTTTTAEELWTHPATLSGAYFAETDSDRSGLSYNLKHPGLGDLT